MILKIFSTCRVIFLVLFLPVATLAGEADVIEVKTVKLGDNTFRFDATISHGDEGWKHYADKWDIVGPDGTVIDTRTLHHPHVNEQPFTRSLSGVTIGKGIGRVTVHAHDSVHEYGGGVVTVDLPR